MTARPNTSAPHERRDCAPIAVAAHWRGVGERNVSCQFMRRTIIIAVVIALVTVCAILWLPAPKVEALVASVAVSSVITNSEGRIIAQCIVTNASQRVLRVGGFEPLSADQAPSKPKPGRMMLIAVGQSVPFQMEMP